MSYTDKGNSEDVESLINTFNIHGTPISEANLSSLSSSDLEHFAELSQSLNMSSDMENQENKFVREKIVNQEYEQEITD